MKKVIKKLRGIKYVVGGVVTVIATLGARLWAKQNPQKVSSFMSGVKNIGTHNVKFTPLYMEKCGHKDLLNAITNVEIEDKLQIDSFDYKDKDGVSFHFDKIDILKGAADEVSKKYPKILKDSKLVLFLYNVDEYSEHGYNYVRDVVDRIAVASEFTKRDCSFYITPVRSQNIECMNDNLASESNRKINDLLLDDNATKDREYEYTDLCNMSDKDCISDLMAKCLEKFK